MGALFLLIGLVANSLGDQVLCFCEVAGFHPELSVAETRIGSL